MSSFERHVVCNVERKCFSVACSLKDQNVIPARGFQGHDSGGILMLLSRLMYGSLSVIYKFICYSIRHQQVHVVTNSTRNYPLRNLYCLATQYAAKAMK